MPTTDRPTRPTGFPLSQARVCLDCDCLTVEQRCPWCDRDGSVPLAAWFRPLEDRKADAVRHGATASPTARPRWILIVQHHQRDLYRVLRQALAGTGVEVLYDRRVGQRRRTAAEPGAGEQRRADRRRPRPSAVVYQESAPAVERETPPAGSAERETAAVVRPRRRQPASV
jgi:hypothetical protein